MQNLDQTDLVMPFNVFLSKIHKFMTDDEYNNLLNLSDNNKKEYIKNFHSSLEDKELFKTFCKRKIKLFSSKNSDTHTVSCSLFNSETVTLKSVFNNRPEPEKVVLWEHLHYLYFLQEYMDQNRQERIERLKIKNIASRDSFIDFINPNDNLNDDTKNFLNNFINNLSNNKPDMDSLMEMAFELGNSNIETNKLLKNMAETVPAMKGISSLLGVDIDAMEEEDVEIEEVDESLSTADVEVGEQNNTRYNPVELMGKISKVMDIMNNIDEDTNMEELLSVLGVDGNMTTEMEEMIKSFDGNIAQGLHEIMNSMGGNLNLNLDLDNVQEENQVVLETIIEEDEQESSSNNEDDN